MRTLARMVNAKTAKPSKYMKVSEVAAQLNLSERHIYDLVSEGVLTSSRFSEGAKALRVHRDSVEAFEAAAAARAS
jgi:excisionase family DNA binding protein